MDNIMTITSGDLEPDIVMTISDSRQDADFTAVTPAAVTIIGTINGAIVLNDNPDSLVLAPDAKSLTLRRSWVSGDTDVAGRMYVRARVAWPAGKPQHFPRQTSLIIDIRRKPGDE